MIDLKELRAGYEGREILAGADLRVGPREIVAVVGANGSGKTTLLDAAAGFIPATGIRRVEGRVGRSFQDDELFPSLTVRESLSAAGGGEDLLERFGLSDHADRWPHELSTGIRRVVEIALVTATSPDVLMLDEPSAGLARSEVANLAEVIRRWRDETGGSVLLVEHDRAMVEAVADRVVELTGGRLGPLAVNTAGVGGDVPAPAEVLHPAERQPALPLRHVSTWRMARWGLRELAAGALSVMVVGVLNRVMAIELAIPLVLVSFIVGGYNLAAPIAIPLGHRSDSRPLFGRRRTGYVIGGAVITGIGACFAPDMAYLIAGSDNAAWSVALGLGLFGLMGVGMYGAGTAFFAFLADQCPPEERSRAAAVVYSELMVGVLAGVALTAVAVGDAGLTELRALFIVVGGAVVVLSTLAVWGSEPPAEPVVDEDRPGFAQALRGLSAQAGARRFFVFLFLATAALFLQQSILEPFGGAVLGLSVGQSTSFNAVLIVGVLVGMGAGAQPMGKRWGLFGVAAAGLTIGAVGFGLLAFGAALATAAPVWIGLGVIGFGTGLFNVAGLSMMMGMSLPGSAGLAMGAWTLAHASADGLATAGGGAFHHLARWATGTEQAGFAVVFGFEGLVLVLLLPLLAGLRRGPAGTLLSGVTATGGVEVGVLNERELPVGLEDAELHAP